jgi:D-glycero-D-manno-heptose 1,7-bisphosphate phosphatase
MIRTVFLDRDGVINVNIPRGYVTSPSILKILPGAASAIKRLNDVNIPVIVISNQQGVGKGLMTAEQLEEVDQALHSEIGASDGAIVARSYYCTHLSSEDCECRKPKGGQLRNAALEFGLELSQSAFVGDTPTDIQAGRDAGVGHCALVLSGATRSYVPGKWQCDADSVHKDLSAAVEWILASNESERTGTGL